MESALENLIKRGESSPFYSLLNIKIDEVLDNYAWFSLLYSKEVTASR